MLILGITAMLFIALSVLVFPGNSVNTGNYIHSGEYYNEKIPVCLESEINGLIGTERNPLYFNYYIYDDHVVVSGEAIAGRTALETYGSPLDFDEGSISLNWIEDGRAYFTFRTVGYDCWFMK